MRLPQGPGLDPGPRPASGRGGTVTPVELCVLVGEEAERGDVQARHTFRHDHVAPVPVERHHRDVVEEHLLCVAIDLTAPLILVRGGPPWRWRHRTSGCRTGPSCPRRCRSSGTAPTGRCRRWGSPRSRQNGPGSHRPSSGLGPGIGVEALQLRVQADGLQVLDDDRHHRFMAGTRVGRDLDGLGRELVPFLPIP